MKHYGCDKYDVNEDEEFLNHLKSENAFAYFLIKNNQRKKYNKSGKYSKASNSSETSQGSFRDGLKLLEYPLIRKTIKYIGKQAKRIIGGAASGVISEIRNRTKNNFAKGTHKLLNDQRLKQGAELIYKGAKRSYRRAI